MRSPSRPEYLRSNHVPAPRAQRLETPELSMHLSEFIALVAPGPIEEEMYWKPKTIPVSASGMI